jgi:hypothetical protein
MTLADILGVTFWVVILSATAICVCFERGRVSAWRRDFLRMLPLGGALVLAAAASGFLMGGTTGALGNSVAAALWYVVLFSMWFDARRRRNRNGEP